MAYITKGAIWIADIDTCIGSNVEGIAVRGEAFYIVADEAILLVEVQMHFTLADIVNAIGNRAGPQPLPIGIDGIAKERFAIEHVGAKNAIGPSCQPGIENVP